MGLRYLLWDHDGVLVDTERWYFEATREVLARLGIELSEQQYLTFMAAGRSCWDLARDHGISDEQIRSLRADRNVLYQEFLETKSIEIAGVDEVLGELSCHHRMAVITSARRHDFDLIHAHRDLVRHFDFILTIEDYARPKPRPDPYLAGLARFGASPAEALALEDSARGLASARAAGIDCLVIRNSFTESQDFTSAWQVVESVRSVPSLLAAQQGAAV